MAYRQPDAVARGIKDEETKGRCNYCGSTPHSDNTMMTRSRECPAYQKICTVCRRTGHVEECHRDFRTLGRLRAVIEDAEAEDVMYADGEFTSTSDGCQGAIRAEEPSFAFP